ncbi:MAG: YfbR-like 5'-deoxynucleotidase [Promethearchaeota archaeon]
MKRLPRQGWVRAGVPFSSVESLADHSWAVAFLTYSLCILENSFRAVEKKTPLDVEKAVLIGLFHDLSESECFDMDKSINNVVNQEQLAQFQQRIQEGAIRNILEKVPLLLKESFEKILNDKNSEEYHLARISDFIDLIHQSKEYRKKHWLDKNQFHEFKMHALQQLQQYKNQFSFLEKYLKEFQF